MKYILKTALLIGMLNTNCVDNQYDLTNVNTDNIALGGEMQAPFGSMDWTLGHLFYIHPSADFQNITVPFYTSLKHVFNIDMNLDSELIKKLTQGGELYIQTEIHNIIPTDIQFSLVFTNENNNPESSITLLDDKFLATASPHSPVSYTFTTLVTTDEFNEINLSNKLYFTIKPTQPNQSFVIDKTLLNRNVILKFTLIKKGGIVL